MGKRIMQKGKKSDLYLNLNESPKLGIRVKKLNQIWKLNLRSSKRRESSGRSEDSTSIRTPLVLKHTRNCCLKTK